MERSSQGMLRAWGDEWEKGIPWGKLYKSSRMGNRTEPRELQVVPPQCEKWGTAGVRLEKRAGDRSKRGLYPSFRISFHGCHAEF